MAKKEIDSESTLINVRMKLKGIAFFLQSYDSNVPLPFDVADCYFGIGEVINECVNDLVLITDAVARLSFPKPKNKRRRKKQTKKKK